MLTKIKPDVWNTYALYGYTYDVANDPRSQGGVHLHQVRRHRCDWRNYGKYVWQKRICQSNGQFKTYSETSELTEAEGLAAFEEAKKY